MTDKASELMWTNEDVKEFVEDARNKKIVDLEAQLEVAAILEVNLMKKIAIKSKQLEDVELKTSEERGAELLRALHNTLNALRHFAPRTECIQSMNGCECANQEEHDTCQFIWEISELIIKNQG